MSPPDYPAQYLAGAGPAAIELRESITTLAQADPRDQFYAAHLTLALTIIARRLDELERRLDQLGGDQ